MDYTYVIQKIRELMNTDSVNKFCKEVGLNQANTNAFLNGKKYSISLDDLMAIANKYGVDLNFFINKKTLKRDRELFKIIDWIELYWKECTAEERTWFKVQMKKTFPEFKEWIEKFESTGDIKREADREDKAQSA